MAETLIVCYTKSGKELMQAARKVLCEAGREVITLERPTGKEWPGNYWDEVREILFIGASGIAVRLIAPFIKDKMTDPAVVVMDEKGQFAIPVLSGHMGGANALARLLSDKMGAAAVITTATDVQGKFAVDVFAKNNGLLFTERTLAKEISAAVLQGEKIGFYAECAVKGKMPEELAFCEEEESLGDFSLGIAVVQRPDAGKRKAGENKKVLYLYPANLTLGIGCKKGKSADELEDLCNRYLTELGLRKSQTARIASIDRKAGEEGLIGLAERWGVPFKTWPEEELAAVKNVSSESGFVRQVTGIGNVCERAAIYGSKNGRLLLEKRAENGMTLAVTAEDWSVGFDEIICSGHRAGKL